MKLGTSMYNDAKLNLLDDGVMRSNIRGLLGQNSIMLTGCGVLIREDAGT